MTKSRLLRINTMFITSIFAILSLYACRQASDKENTEKADSVRTDSVKAEATAFTPNPQKVAKQDVKTLEIGAPAPDFSLPDVSGKFYSLKDFSDAKVLVIFFTCNHCPTAQAYEDRQIEFTKEYKDKGVAVAGIMPNSTLGLLLEEGGYTDLNDSYEEMKIRVTDKGYNFPYLYDGDNQKVAIAYGPTTTPHAFVFDSDRKLAYQGRLDAVEKPGKANSEDLRAAVDAVLAGKKVETPITKAFGCSVKWQWKSEYVSQVEKEWTEKPVTLAKLNAAGIKKLASNPSKKLRLINVWATWCAPCVAEYPEFVKIQRMYGQRDFEFVSLSADEPQNQDKALAFLEKKYSSVQNYLYEGTDKYKLIEALDPQWNGALPYTMLVEPGGKVVYRYQGAVDPQELKKTIVEHPMIGRFY